MRIAGLVLMAGLGAGSWAGAQQGPFVEAGTAAGLVTLPAMLQQAPAWTTMPRPIALHLVNARTMVVKKLAADRTPDVCYAMRSYQYARDTGETGKPERTGYETCVPASRLKTESVLLIPAR